MSYPPFRLAMAAMSAALLLVPGAADAQYRGRGGHAYQQQGYGYADRGGYRSGRDDRQGGYRDNRYRGARGYRCDRGTGGTIIGAIAGGLLGNAAAGRGDRDVGTVVGAGVGALAGRAVDRDC